MAHATRVAVVGGGAAGMAAADRLLQHGMSVTLFEPAARLGGNCVGVDVRLPDGRTCTVDAGVSDFNAETFVRFAALLAELDVAVAPICQDAAFVDARGHAPLFVRAGTPRCESSDAAALLGELTRFSRESVEVLDDPRWYAGSVGAFLRDRGFSERFGEQYLLPRARGCFAMPGGDPSRFPIRPLVAFWTAHGLVGRTALPPRMAVVGGMHRYVAAFERRLAAQGCEIRRRTAVVGLSSRGGGLELHSLDATGRAARWRFDAVVVATTPRLGAALLGGDWGRATARLRSQRARVVVHTDPRVMPRERDRWGAYNYTMGTPGTVPRGPTITFFPKRMRALPDDAPDVFVTMNPERAIDPASILVERRFEHPIATPDRDEVVARLDALQGCGRAWLCGSHLRAPFLHEQAIEDGQRVADRLADSSHHGRVSFTAPATPPSPRSPSAVASPSAPVGAIGAAVEAPALAIGHHHAPGEPCTPLARAEVERALADLRR